MSQQFKQVIKKGKLTINFPFIIMEFYKWYYLNNEATSFQLITFQKACM